jgi:H+/Cl- antiporter ClcA
MKRGQAIRDGFTEESILFFSVLKWVVLATVTGGLVGCSTALFLYLLRVATHLAGIWPYTFLLIPFAFFLSSLVVRYGAPDAEGHGTEKVIEAFHKRAGRITPLVVPVKLFATILTLATGGSAGKEGPCAQIGAGMASMLADFLRFGNLDRKKLAICGISAGFAAVFGTPISGAIFGIEVLFVGSLLYDGLLASFVAGITSYQIAKVLGVMYFTHSSTLVPPFNEAFFVKVALAGVFFGLCSVLLIEGLDLGKRLSMKIPIWPPLKGLVGGAALVVTALLWSRRYLGLGLESIEDALRGADLPWNAFLSKIVSTSLTLNFGGSGGIVTPIFFIGATSGAFLGHAVGLDPATFAAIGLVSVLAGAANTPLAASIMAVELFGPQIAPYAAVSCIISFLITGHRSVYPSQVLSLPKSASISVQVGAEMDHLDAQFHLRRKGLIFLLAHWWRHSPRHRNRDERKEDLGDRDSSTH